MREFLTVDRVANEIRLRRSTYSGTFLLVEGSSDKTFYERFVDKLACTLVTTSGNPSSKQRAIRNLRLAYEAVYFYKTHLYSEIRLWETNNQLFKVLQNDV